MGGTKHVEVDFLLVDGSRSIAIEAKASKRLPAHFVGLQSIAELPGLKRRVLVYLGDELRQYDGVEVWPVAHFIDRVWARKLA